MTCNDSLSNIHNTVQTNRAETVIRILNTCEEMLVDRGYVVTYRIHDPDLVGKRINPVIIGHRAEDTEDNTKASSILVFVVGEEDKVGVKTLRNILSLGGEGKDESDICSTTSYIIVSKDGPTPFTRKEANSRIQFFKAKELCFNVTKHALVPKHEVVTSLPPGVDVKELPKILDTDPVVQHYNWPPGTVLMVMRKFGTDQPIPYYRVVCLSN